MNVFQLKTSNILCFPHGTRLPAAESHCNLYSEGGDCTVGRKFRKRVEIRLVTFVTCNSSSLSPRARSKYQKEKNNLKHRSGSVCKKKYTHKEITVYFDSKRSRFQDLIELTHFSWPFATEQIASRFCNRGKKKSNRSHRKNIGLAHWDKSAVREWMWRFIHAKNSSTPKTPNNKETQIDILAEVLLWSAAEEEGTLQILYLDVKFQWQESRRKICDNDCLNYKVKILLLGICFLCRELDEKSDTTQAAN